MYKSILKIQESVGLVTFNVYLDAHVCGLLLRPQSAMLLQNVTMFDVHVGGHIEGAVSHAICHG